MSILTEYNEMTKHYSVMLIPVMVLQFLTDACLAYVPSTCILLRMPW